MHKIFVLQQVYFMLLHVSSRLSAHHEVDRLCINSNWYFDVLLTVHLSIFISVINQLDAQNFCFNKFISCFYMFRAHLLITRRSKLHYTASGITLKQVSGPVGGACARCDDTRGCVMQF